MIAQGTSNATATPSEMGKRGKLGKPVVFGSAPSCRLRFLCLSIRYANKARPLVTSLLHSSSSSISCLPRSTGGLSLSTRTLALVPHDCSRFALTVMPTLALASGVYDCLSRRRDPKPRCFPCD